MTFGICILVAILGPGSANEVQATDFFPLTPGLKTSYSDSALKNSVLVDEVRPEMVIEDQHVTPVKIFRDGVVLDTVYYKASGDQVFIAAYDPAHLLAKPRPFFKAGAGKQEWSYTGETPLNQSVGGIELKGESRPGGRKKVLGTMVDTLIVKLDAMVGNASQVVQDHQEILLAKDIGLVEMTETVTIGRKTQSHTVKLIDFQPGSHNP